MDKEEEMKGRKIGRQTDKRNGLHGLLLLGGLFNRATTPSIFIYPASSTVKSVSRHFPGPLEQDQAYMGGPPPAGQLGRDGGGQVEERIRPDNSNMNYNKESV